MTSFTAQVRAWAEKAKRNHLLVLRLAAQEVFRRATQRQASITETGSFEVGKIPVDTGHLIGTAEVRIRGAAVASGNPGAGTPPDYAVAIGYLEGGEAVELVFTAEYARHVEYGASKMPGRFYVRTAVADWQQIVDRAAAQVGK